MKGYTIDFREFGPQGSSADIKIREIDTTTIILKIGERDIKQLQMLYNNASPYTYDMELLILVDCSDNKEDKSGQTFELFGAVHTECDGNTNEMIETYVKDLDYPIFKRNAAVIAFLRMQQSLSLIIFEDGYVSQLTNHKNAGITKSDLLKIPFNSVNSAIYEEESGMLCLQTILRQRRFF
jgi:hypothetical protein